MKSNEKDIVKFLDAIINNDVYVEQAQKFIKENYGVNSEYDKETNTIYIWTTNVFESLNVAGAGDYLLDTFTPEMINVVYGMKDKK